MGEIFLTQFTGAHGFDKLCVVKKVLPDLAQEPEFIARFIDEAQILVQLSHGNIAQVLDMGVHEGEPFLALEFVDGKDLRRVLSRMKERGLPLPLSFVLSVMIRVLDALAYAHRKRGEDGHELNLVHRDLSPDNFIKAAAEYKLIDFEVSRKTDAGVTATIVGKHAYISPEQFRGKTSQQSDIYSLGATLYFLLTARDPEPINQSCLSEGDTGYGTILDKIIQKCTDLDLSNRFGSVSEIQDWLSNAEGTVINIKAEREVEEAKIWQS